MPRVLAFDIGIKNLAWCCADLGGAVVVRGWANENLISGDTAEAGDAAAKCSSCSARAGFVLASSAKGYCVRHCPPLTPALRDLSGAILKKIPAAAVLKALALAADAAKTDLKSKAAMIAFLEKRYCFPRAAGAAVKKVEMEALHDGIRAMILKNRDLFITCSEILLENQPVLKNPVMKSVQMMLFASLRDLLDCRPTVRLVHAGRKTTGATKGDEGYSERKGASEARVFKGFGDGVVQYERGVEWFNEQKKRSDLADCLCMLMDCGAAAAAAAAKSKA
jgi:hypothetical protein